MLRRMILPMFLAGVIATPVLAQQAGGDQPGGQGNGGQGGGRQRGGGNGGGPGGGGGAQFRQQMMDRLKEQLGTNDDEWKVVEPKLTKVMEAQRDARAGGFGGFGGGRGNRGGGPGGGGPGGAANADQPQSPVQKATNDLRQALDNKSASTEEITQKLTALRDAREKAHQSLVSAQKDLKDVLTPRQEAVLVANGMLD